MWTYRYQNRLVETDSLGELINALYRGAEIPDITNETKEEISKYTQCLPLYDIESNHIFLIDKENLYPRIVYDKYRMVDEEFYRELTSMKNPSEMDVENHRFLSFYHIPTLLHTFYQIFYQSFVISTFITNCRRPSFTSKMEHINPYYTINELNYLAYDWGLVSEMTLDRGKLSELCQQIRHYDIPAATLIDHQLYIYENKAIGLVKHYSLFGSYYMNRYLRRTLAFLPESENTMDTIRNLNIENQIMIMVKLARRAPAFRKSHTVYRFIETDDHLTDLRVGDTYTDPAFTSTTRNPFYYKENYAFGFILVKITLPKGVTGVGLCIESFSNFPSEEEIVLLPGSTYQLDRIIEKEPSKKLDADSATGLRVHKKYEFTWTGNIISEINLDQAYTPEINLINLHELVLERVMDHLTISERLHYFRTVYANVNNQFQSKIGDNIYTFSYESYDSTSVYKPFFYYSIKDGIMLTTSNPKYGNINLLMEIGIDIHVNYYFRYSLTDTSMVVNLDSEEWIDWFAMLAYLMGCRNVIIHPSYTHSVSPGDTDRQKIDKTRYTYPRDIYLYLKEGKRLFLNPAMNARFDYGQLDRLQDTMLADLLKPTDRNELHRLWQSTGIENAKDFYLYLAEKNPKRLADFQRILDGFYDTDNPFHHISYRLDAWSYLYDKSVIRVMPSDKEFSRKGSFKRQIGNDGVVKFTNRLRDFIRGSG
jgi:hypothetical protein